MSQDTQAASRPATSSLHITREQAGPIVLAGALVFLFLMRLPFLTAYESYVADIGSYLMTRNWILGLDPVGFPDLHFRPPLVGVLQLPFTMAMGDLMGNKLIALLASVLPAVPMYVLLRRHTSPAWAVLGALAVICVPLWGEKTAGGYLTVLNAAVIIWAVDTLWQIQEGQVRPWALLWPALLAVGLNQTTGVWLAGILAAMGGGLVLALGFARVFGNQDIVDDSKAGLIRSAKAGGWAFLGAAVWSWFYLVNLPAQDGAYIEGGVLLGWVTDGFAFMQAIIILTAAAILPWAKSRLFLFPGLVLAFCANLVSSQVSLANLFGRADYLLPIFTVIAAVLLLHGLAWVFVDSFPILAGKMKSLGFAMGIAAIFSLALSWNIAFADKAETVPVVDQESRAVLDWMRLEVPYDERVAAHPMGLSWYVGGYAQRDFFGAWAGKPERWAMPAYEALGCTLGFVDACDPLALHREHGIRYVLIDEGSPEGLWLAPDGFSWASWHQPAWLQEIHRVGDVALYEVRAPLHSVVGGLDGAPTELRWHEGNLYLGYLAGRIVKVDGAGFEPFIDLSEHVRSEDGFAQGMQSFAFGPDGHVYAAYNVEGGETVARVARDGSVSPLYTVQAPEFPQAEQRWFHNGGSIAFVENDLYVSFGEFHTAPHEPGLDPQDWDNAIGGVVRINLETGEAETVAKGFRNPWKLTATPDGNLLIADVGEGTYEEVNLLEEGGNYGWPLMEGPVTYIKARKMIRDPEVPDVPETNEYVIKALTKPIYADLHDDGTECGIIGGLVIDDRYFFTDLCEGILRSLDWRTGEAQVVAKARPNIYAMATDGDRLYFTTPTGVYRMEVP